MKQEAVDLLTEGQARTKWCPFVRVTAVGDGRSPWTNRQDELGSKAVECIASKCMAWRWFDYQGLDEPIGTTWRSEPRDADWFEPGAIVQPVDEHEREFIKLRPMRGYCGLAGRPK